MQLGEVPVQLDVACNVRLPPARNALAGVGSVPGHGTGVARPKGVTIDTGMMT